MRVVFLARLIVNGDETKYSYSSAFHMESRSSIEGRLVGLMVKADQGSIFVFDEDLFLSRVIPVT